MAYDYVNALLSDASAGPLLDSGFGSANDAALQALGPRRWRPRAWAK
jgi:spermidine/putrescine transport system substrate-binding protein